jgi:hypothetical protein
MTSKINSKFRFFFRLQVQKEKYGYVSLRIIGRKGLKKQLDIPVYLDAQRLTLKKNQFKDGQVVSGLPAHEVSRLNTELNTLKQKANTYVTYNNEFTREQIEAHLYGLDFLEKKKGKRLRSLEIIIKKEVPTPLALELRNEFPKKKIKKELVTIDADGFEIIQQTEVIIDPLSLENFPANFPPKLYERFKAEALAIISQDVRESYLLPNKKFFLDQFILFYIQSGRKLYTKEVKEIITIDKDVIKSVEIKENVKIENDYNTSAKVITKLVNEQKEKERATMPTELVYKKSLWNKQNIFEMFGTIYFDDTIPDTYRKILIRLIEYRELRQPKEDLKYFNVNWLIDFFTFLKENGYYAIQTKTFDPLKYVKQIFYQAKERTPYKPKSLNKMIGITKTLINSSNKFSFYKKGYLPKLDLSDLKLSAITDQKDEVGTRIEHNLNKDELDQIFWFQFDKKKLNQYQQIFDNVNKSKSVIISIDELEKAKKLFILQTMFGGLRGFKELHTAKLLKHKEGVWKVAFYQNKVTQTIHNPLNDYTDKILKPLNYVIPQLVRVNAKVNKVTANIDLLEQHYRSLVQSIGLIINLDREVITDNVNFISKPIKKIFNPYFSRKTFGTILATKLNLADRQIELFTGHKGDLTELSSSYVQRNTIEEKTKLLKFLKVGKNPYK